MEKNHIIYKNTPRSDSRDGNSNALVVLDSSSTPKSYRYHINIGNMYLKQNEFSKAIVEYSQAVGIDQSIATTFVNRGIAYSKTGQNDRACSDWRKACDLGECNMIVLAKQRGLCL